MNYILGVTGASCSFYALRLLDFFLQKGDNIHFVVSDCAQKVMQQESGNDWNFFLNQRKKEFSHLQVWDNDDFLAPIASGSFPVAAMIILPTSMATLAAIAHGISGNLLQRAADVMLKERKKLVLVPRESPFSPIHLENMLKLARLGVHIIPPIPAFYIKPQTIEQLIDFAIGRILDIIRIEHDLYPRWQGETRRSIND